MSVITSMVVVAGCAGTVAEMTFLPALSPVPSAMVMLPPAAIPVLRRNLSLPQPIVANSVDVVDALSASCVERLTLSVVPSGARKVT